MAIRGSGRSNAPTHHVASAAVHEGTCHSGEPVRLAESIAISGALTHPVEAQAISGGDRSGEPASLTESTMKSGRGGSNGPMHPVDEQVIGGRDRHSGEPPHLTENIAIVRRDRW